eukprot:scaffold803_cov310-Pinguiococcus_pyrenoidosus.AAC.53
MPAVLADKSRARRLRTATDPCSRLLLAMYRLSVLFVASCVGAGEAFRQCRAPLAQRSRQLTLGAIASGADVQDVDFELGMEDVVSLCKRRGFVFQSRWVLVEWKQSGKKRFSANFNFFSSSPLPPPSRRCSEIYNGFNGFYDYGPLGVELKKNIKEAWWRAVVYARDDVVGIDSSIIMSPKVMIAYAERRRLVVWPGRDVRFTLAYA